MFSARTGVAGTVSIQVKERPSTAIAACGSGAVVKLRHPRHPGDPTKTKSARCIRTAGKVHLYKRQRI